MRLYLFVISLLIAPGLFASYDCDSDVQKKLAKKYNNKKKRVQECLHVQELEKIIAIVELAGEQGALSLFVFEERDFTEASFATARVINFAIDGLRPSGKRKFQAVDFLAWDLLPGSAGILLLQFKNEVDIVDVGILKLSQNGRVENVQWDEASQADTYIVQTETMDLKVFKVDGSTAVHFFPDTGKVVFSHQGRGPATAYEVRIQP